MYIRLVHKIFYWNFQKCKADLCYILIDKQMLERVFCLNVGTRQLNFLVPGALCQVTANVASGVYLKRAFKMQFRILISGHMCPPVERYRPRQFRPMNSTLQNRWFPELNEGTFGYLSKCNIKLPGIFRNSKKKFFMNRSKLYIFIKICCAL